MLNILFILVFLVNFDTLAHTPSAIEGRSCRTKVLKGAVTARITLFLYVDRELFLYVVIDLIGSTQ